MLIELDGCKYNPCSTVIYGRGETHHKCLLLGYIIDKPETIPDDCPFWQCEAYDEEKEKDNEV